MSLYVNMLFDGHIFSTTHNTVVELRGELRRLTREVDDLRKKMDTERLYVAIALRKDCPKMV